MTQVPGRKYRTMSEGYREEGRDSGRVLEEDSTGPADGLDVGHEAKGQVQDSAWTPAVYSAGKDRNRVGAREAGWIYLEGRQISGQRQK